MLGRQAVRKLLKPSQPRLQLGTSAEPSPSKQANNSIEMPLSMDTDAENVFSRGAEHFWRRGSRHGPAHPDDWTEETQLKSEESRRDLRRRKAVSDLFVVDEDEVQPRSRTGNSDPLPPQEGRGFKPEQFVPPPSPSTFFRRLGGSSFPSLPSPFASVRRSVAGSQHSRAGSVQAWSSDSSSEDEFDRRSAARFGLETMDPSPLRIDDRSDEEWMKEEPEVDS
jgi:hypothetical protein